MKNHIAEKIVFLFLIGLGMFVSAVCIGAWIVNILFAVNQISGGGIGGFDQLYGWLKQQYPRIWYVISVDRSTVTTFLSMITTLYLTFGIGKIYRVQNRSNLSSEGHPNNSKTNVLYRDHFPFWGGYKNTYVQLGLLGTLLGFMLAFGETTGSNPDRILQALGTALWSTFSGVLLAFVVCPSAEKPFRFLIHKMSGRLPQREVKQEVIDMAQGFHALASQIGETKETLQKFTVEIGYLASVQAALRQLYQDVEEIKRSQKEYRQRMDERFTEERKQLQAWLKEKVEEDHKMTNEMLSQIRDSLHQMETKREADQKEISQMRSQIKRLEANHENNTATLSEMKSQMQQMQERMERGNKKRLEFLADIKKKLDGFEEEE